MTERREMTQVEYLHLKKTNMKINPLLKLQEAAGSV